MGTKNNPGKFDCYANAEPDEPMFVLLARDELAPELVRLWALIRGLAPEKVINTTLRNALTISRYKNKSLDEEKFNEALACAKNMEAWRKAQQEKPE